MKVLSIASAVALLAAFVQAAPAPVPAQVNARTDTAKIKFEGAANAEYVLYFPVDGSTQYIGTDQSMSRISTSSSSPPSCSPSLNTYKSTRGKPY